MEKSIICVIKFPYILALDTYAHDLSYLSDF